MGTGPH